MRTSLFFILLATAAMPALAAGPNDHGGRGGDRQAARAERNDNGRSDNSQRPQRAERSDRAPRVQRTQPIVQSNQSAGRSSGFSGRRNGAGNRPSAGAQSAPVVSRNSNDGVTNWRSRERYSGGRTSPTIPTTTQQTRSRYSGDRSGTNWRDRTRTSQTTTTNRSSNWSGRDGNHDGRRWSSNWRSDHRYDWRNYRNRYRSVFHLGRYNDPFGYGYRRFSIGFSLFPGYYSSNYWLNDPYQYRLPPAYGPYRWVRYYNDALLVDTYTGEVVDVIYGFFW
jgi:hypothetical protein